MTEPSETPTPKRVRSARAKGQVALSRDAIVAAAMFAALATLFATRSAILDAFSVALATAVRAAGGRNPSPTTAALAQAGLLAFRILVPILLAGIAAAGLVGALLTRFLIAPAAALPRLDRLNPAEALARYLKARTYLEPFFQLAKGVLLIYLGWEAVHTMLPQVLSSPRIAPHAFSHLMGEVARATLVRMVTATALFAVLDVFYRRWQHARSLRMTKEDVKRERRESEGDPRTKTARERMHRELLAEATLDKVRKADFLVTNPTHYAAALSWDEQTMEAPELIAKGEGDLALRMIREAQRAGVVVLRDAPLARALHEVDIGEAVPETLYEAVAAVVTYLAGGNDPDQYGEE